MAIAIIAVNRAILAATALSLEAKAVATETLVVGTAISAENRVISSAIVGNKFRITSKEEFKITFVI